MLVSRAGILTYDIAAMSLNEMTIHCLCLVYVSLRNKIVDDSRAVRAVIIYLVSRYYLLRVVILLIISIL